MTDFQKEIKTIVTVDETLLQNAGFTQSGVKQAHDTILDYSTQLLSRAEAHGEIVKAHGMPPEITHDHVRASAHAIAGVGRAKPHRKWMIFSQVSEYLATAVAGAGAGYLSAPWGVFAFGVGLATAVLLVFVRLVDGRGE